MGQLAIPTPLQVQEMSRRACMVQHPSTGVRRAELSVTRMAEEELAWAAHDSAHPTPGDILPFGKL